MTTNTTNTTNTTAARIPPGDPLVCIYRRGGGTHNDIPPMNFQFGTIKTCSRASYWIFSGMGEIPLLIASQRWVWHRQERGNWTDERYYYYCGTRVPIGRGDWAGSIENGYLALLPPNGAHARWGIVWVIINLWDLRCEILWEGVRFNRRNQNQSRWCAHYLTQHSVIKKKKNIGIVIRIASVI